MSFAPTQISLLPPSAHTDLELIERVDQSLEILQGKWKVTFSSTWPGGSIVIAGSSPACPVCRRR